MSAKPAITSPEEIAPLAAEPPGAALFPLPLTPFELYFLYEDRPGYEGVIPLLLEAHGPLDRAVLEQAYRMAHGRHPLLSARIDQSDSKRPVWVAAEPPPITYAGETDAAHGPSSAPLPNAHLTVDQVGDDVIFLFAFRHIAVDGLGVFQFVADLFLAYAHLCNGEAGAPRWRKLDPQCLRDRDGHQLFNRRLKVSDFLQMAKVHLPLSLWQAARVSTAPQRGPDDQLEPGLPTDFLVEHLTVAETDALNAVAARHDVMLNDLLVRDYFLMLADWNRGTPEARRWIRVMIPTNMRRREDLRMPAANVFSYAFLSRRARDFADPQKLLLSIHEEMNAIKRDKRGLYYEAALRLFSKWPAFLRWSLNRDWAFATAVFTNLGTGFDHVPVPTLNGRKVAGELVFEIGAGAGPIRPGTHISFAAHNYAGRLAICALCDSRLLTPRQQHALLTAYISRLRTTLAE